MDSLKLRRIGEAVVVTIPDDVLAQFNLKEGDSLRLDLGPDRFTLKPELPAEDLASAQRMMQRYDGVLQRLAK